jgi:hypothetical protein
MLVFQVELDAVPVYFEHQRCFKDPKVEVGTKSLKGAVKRMVAEAEGDRADA